MSDPAPLKTGAIVRHTDYPAWGRGYIIRATKRTTTAFFQWGGKRKIAAGEPLEPARAVGAEVELFALCAEITAHSWSRGHHTIYAVELDPAVLKVRAFKDRNPGAAAGVCLYVGVTGLAPEARFDRHLAGTQSARFVKRYGKRLRLDLVEGYSRLPFTIAAWMEPKLAAWLRAQGFGVWQN
jgi:hypothetical protein